MPQKSHKRPKSWSQSDPFSISAWHFLRKFHICHSPSLTPHISRVHHAHHPYLSKHHAYICHSPTPNALANARNHKVQVLALGRKKATSEKTLVAYHFNYINVNAIYVSKNNAHKKPITTSIGLNMNFTADQ